MDYETNPVKAIRKHCLDCCCGSSDDVKNCEITTCYLHPFRLGKNPYRTPRQYSEEQRMAMGERLASYRSNKA